MPHMFLFVPTVTPFTSSTLKRPRRSSFVNSPPCLTPSSPTFPTTTTTRTVSARRRLATRASLAASPDDFGRSLARDLDLHARGGKHPAPVPPAAPSAPPATPADDGQQALQHLRLFGRDWYVSGRVLLLLTPLLWGAYTVLVKMMYGLPWALSAPVFNTIRLGLASAIVLPGFVAHLRSRPGGVREAMRSASLRGGAEIGLWTFVVNILQMVGLVRASASVAAFLCQLFSVFVPFAAYFLGMEKSIRVGVYVASVLSVIGVGLFSIDDAAAPFTLAGEGVLLLSAFAATTFIIRCKRHAAHDNFSAVIAVKILIQFVISLFFLIPTIARALAAKTTLAALFAGATPLLLLANAGIVFYNGAIVAWLSTIFQLKGQHAVSATEASIIFASTPIWSALMAIPLGERFGARGLLGAALIIVATVLASLKPKLKSAPTPTPTLTPTVLQQEQQQVQQVGLQFEHQQHGEHKGLEHPEQEEEEKYLVAAVNPKN